MEFNPKEEKMDRSRFLILTDIHSSIRNGGDDARIGKRIMRLLYGLHNTTRGRILETFRGAASHGPYDAIIDLGDRTSGHQGLGLCTPHAVKEAEEVLGIFQEVFGDTKRIFIPGNHDLGYGRASFSWRSNGYLKEVIDRYRKVYGQPIFGSRSLTEEVIFIWITSEPFLLNHLQPELSASAEKQERKRAILLRHEFEHQLSFAEAVLRENSDKRFILGVHEPSALLSPRLQGVLDPHRHRLIVTLTGHVHARWLMNGIRLVRPGIRRIFKDYKIQMIPSVWGYDLNFPRLASGPGAGWAILELPESGKPELLLYRTNRRKFKGVGLET